jgi:hypothetical protein
MIFRARTTTPHAPLECGDLSPLCPVATCRDEVSAGAMPKQAGPLDAALVARPVAQRQSGDESPHSRA